MSPIDDLLIEAALTDAEPLNEAAEVVAGRGENGVVDVAVGGGRDIRGLCGVRP
jgi:hypothetical protein